MEVKHSVFSHNFAQKSGGAISIMGGFVRIHQASFSHNVGALGAAVGVVQTYGRPKLIVDTCALQQNGNMHSGAVLLLHSGAPNGIGLEIASTRFNASEPLAMLWTPHIPSKYTDAEIMLAQPIASLMVIQGR
eukprot:SAG11_NODE_1875_length_4143_cov_1.538328_3_plen_133_part_00